MFSYTRLSCSGDMTVEERISYNLNIRQNCKSDDVLSPGYLRKIYRYDVSFPPRSGLLLSSLPHPSSTAQIKRPFHYQIQPLPSGQNRASVHKPKFSYIYFKTVPGKPYLIFNSTKIIVGHLRKVQTHYLHQVNV